MAIPHSLHEKTMAIFEDVMHVYGGWRAMNELVAKLHEEMQDPSMQEKISGHMQSLSILVAVERGLEQRPRRTQNLPPMCQEEEDERLVMMYAKADDIQCCIQGDATED